MPIPSLTHLSHDIHRPVLLITVKRQDITFSVSSGLDTFFVVVCRYPDYPFLPVKLLATLQENENNVPK